MSTSEPSSTPTDPGVTLLGTNDGDRRVEDALADLLAGDGTVYIVSGYFTYHGYRAIRDDVVAFLERAPENELVVVVGPASDQFSARIARDLWGLDHADRVRIYKRPRGLHAKLYVRDGPDPRCIVGSANITQVAFEYNIELGIEMTRDSADHPDIEQFLAWADRLVAEAEPLRRHDVLAPVQVGASLVNWSNKARLLPARHVLFKVTPVLVLVVLVAVVFGYL